MLKEQCILCEKPALRLDSQGLCERCSSLKGKVEAWIEQSADEEAALKKELGIPDGALTNWIPFLGEWQSEDWQGYLFESFGIVFKPIPVEKPSGVLIHFGDSDNPTDEDWLVQVWQQKVTHTATTIYGEVRWHPEHGEQVSIKGIEQAKGKQDIDLIWNGLNLLPKVREEMRRGRPTGSVFLHRRQFLDDAIKAYREFLSTHDERPTQYDIAAALQIVRSTFSRYLKTYGISWDEIREGATKDL
jgi:hypothetical protein